MMKKVFLFLSIFIFPTTALFAQAWDSGQSGQSAAATSSALVDTASDIRTSLTTVQSLIIDTLTVAWALVDTVLTGDLPGWKAPVNGTIVEVGGYTDANTTTFNFEKRAATTPNTTGTDALSSDLVADSDQQVTTTINSASFTKGEWVVPTVSATGDVALGSVYFLWVRR